MDIKELRGPENESTAVKNLLSDIRADISIVIDLVDSCHREVIEMYQTVDFEEEYQYEAGRVYTVLNVLMEKSITNLMNLESNIRNNL